MIRFRNSPHAVRRSWSARHLFIAAVLCGTALASVAAETVRVSLFSWPGYGFWFIAKEKNLVPEIALDIQIIEDPYQSFGAMAAGQLDVTSSTVEYGPIAAEQQVPVKFVTYTNPSIGTDKIILAPGIADAQALKGRKVAVLEGGLTQIYMGIWLENHGVKFDEVEYVNVIMDDAVGAMVSGQVAAGELWEPFGSKVLENLAGATVVTTSAEPYWKQTALLGDGMYMTAAFLKDKPALAAATMKAYFLAVDYWKKHPAEGNAIIAKGLKFSVPDVELVIGRDGRPLDGGIWVFDLDEAARFMRVKQDPPPIGSANGIEDHWKLTNEWWVKFGLMKKTLPPSAGIDLAPLQATTGATQ
ncbi:MAG: ABC transporter substrate-binding protein [Gammaproteobacteria bacterium]